EFVYVRAISVASSNVSFMLHPRFLLRNCGSMRLVVACEFLEIASKTWRAMSAIKARILFGAHSRGATVLAHSATREIFESTNTKSIARPYSRRSQRDHSIRKTIVMVLPK